jgi:hypothetical protein
MVLGEDASKVHLPCLGRPISLLATPALQFLCAHRHSSPVGADVEDRGIGASSHAFSLLPVLGARSNPLNHPLYLAGRHKDAASFGKMPLGLVEAGFVSPLQTDQTGQCWSVAALQTESGISGKVTLMLARMMVIVALQTEGSKEALELHPSPTLAVFTGTGFVGGIQPVGCMLEEQPDDTGCGLENGSPQQHLHLLHGRTGRGFAGEAVDQFGDFRFLREQTAGGVFF